MGAFETLTSTVGLLGLCALGLFLLCRFLGGWTRIRAWLWSSREEKMVLTRRTRTGSRAAANANMNGCHSQAPSASDLNLSGGGSFRRFENAERGSSSSAAGGGGHGIAMKTLAPSNNNNNNNASRQQWSGQFVPPPPLRSAGTASTGPPNYLPNQGSVDAVFLNPLASPGGIPPKLPPPPNGGGRRGSGGGSGSGPTSQGMSASTNPFMPLIQASTQFFSQTIQSFQNAAAPVTGSNVSTAPQSSGNGISMGELLFSAQPLYGNKGPTRQQQQDPEDKYSLINFYDGEEPAPKPHSAMRGEHGSSAGAYPLSPPSTHHPIASLGRSQHQHQQKQMHGRIIYEDDDNMILIETGKDLMDRHGAAAGSIGSGSISDGASTSTGDVERDGVFSDDDEHQRRDSLLESMRAEIRLENERMEDATKSLLMGDDDATFKTGSSGRAGSIEEKYRTPTHAPPNASSFLPRPAAADRKYSAPEIGCGLTQHSNQQHPLSSHGNIQEKAIQEDARAGSDGGDDDDGSLLDYVRNRQASIEQLRYSTSVDNNASAAGRAGAESGAATNNGIAPALALLASLSETRSSSCSSSSRSGSTSTSLAISSSHAAATAPALLSTTPAPRPPQVVVPIVQVVPSCTSPSFVLGPASTSPAAYGRARSFSLRQQSSTDSIGDISDLMSPESGAALPTIQRAMSCDSVCSDTSVILGDLDPPHVTGQLFVGLEYDSETADLIVNVIEGKDLLGLDPDPTSPFDSYVRVYLLPDKTTNMQTRVYRKSLSPVYKEKFMFGLEESELPTRSLVFYLYATNKHSNTLIGEAELKLNELDLDQPKLTWLALTDTTKRGGELGEIMFSLSYLPTAERLTVVVVKARNLKFPHGRETGDPFVKVYLLQKGKKVSKKKSSTKRNERNPIFNEAMIFSVPTHALQTIQLRITVSDSSENDSRAYSIGHIIIGSASSGKPLSHWSQMLASLRKPIAMWHSLRK